MDQEALVVGRVESGHIMLRDLIHNGVEITAACWLRGQEPYDPWFLFIATPLVSAEGDTREAYGRIFRVFKETQQNSILGGDEITAVAPSSPVGKACLALQKGRPAGKPLRVSAGRFGDQLVEEGFVYPATAIAP